mgnify:CR=1 FL=1
MSKRTITIEDLYKIAVVSRPRISPDGKQVAYVVTTIDEHKHEYRSAIWLSSTSGGEARRLTGGPANANDPVWSPDGHWLAFTSERAGEASRAVGEEQRKQGKDKPQIWLLPIDGGEARQLTFLPHGAHNPVWSPDSRRIAFEAGVGPLEELNDDGKPFPQVRVIDRLWYRLDGVGYIYERRNHMFLIERDGGEPVQLTDGDWDESGPAWSPDGTHLAFTSSRSDDRWRTPAPDVYTLAINDGKAGELRCLTDGSLGCLSPSWSPDGRTLALLGALKLRSGGHVDVYTVAADATQAKPTCLTWDFEGSFQDWLNSDLGDEHIAPAPVWSSDGETLYALAAYRGGTQIFSIARTGAGANPPALTPTAKHVRDFSADRAAGTLALAIGNATRPPEIFVRALHGDGELRGLTGWNDALCSELQLSEPEYLPYSGVEGWPMDGWILKPPDFDPAKKYPMILQIHGGPHTEFGYGFFHEMQVQAAQGYVVLFTNPRGSSGYGRDFSLTVRGAWGEMDSLDIMAGVDALIAKGYIDESRLGVTGGSYGGFMTNWLVGHTDRFRVAVTDRCVANLASMFGASDVGWEFGEDEFEAVPWENLDRLMKYSPISYVQNIHTPLLIIHSEQDLRCGIEQAEQLFTALKYLGREAQFVRFEGQSHGLSRGGHPKLRLERLRHGSNWFEKYMR